MKKQLVFPALAVGGGVGALALRLAQNRTGFEADTGLAIRGNIPAMALTAFAFLLAAALLALLRRLPKDQKAAFPGSFSTKESAFLTLPVIGCLLMLLSGGADLAAGLDIAGTAVFSNRFHLILGIFAILSSLCLILSLSACRSGKWTSGDEFNGTLLLPVIVMLVMRLVVTYRLCSIDPTVEGYVIEILAMVFLTMGFFHLSSFAFGEGKPHIFTFCAVMATIFSLASAADFGTHILCVSSVLLYVGGGAALLGFLLLYLNCEQDPPSDDQKTAG